MTTVLLVDDHPLVRVGFRLILESAGGFEVVGEASDGRTAINQVDALDPDVVLMDVRMPGINGIDATKRIVEAHPEVRVLILTTFDLDQYAFAALRAGASGFLLKDAAPVDLITAVRTVASGDAVVSPRVTRRMLELFASQLPETGEPPDADAPHPRLAGLTPRELEVLHCIADAQSNAEIAARLFLSDATVKTHVARILAKLGVRDRVHAVVLAYETGLVHASIGVAPGALSGFNAAHTDATQR